MTTKPAAEPSPRPSPIDPVLFDRICGLAATLLQDRAGTSPEYIARLERPVADLTAAVLVHRAATLLHASFRPRLATTPLRFANPSPPSGWMEDFHLQAVDHARHTEKAPHEAGQVGRAKVGHRVVTRRPTSA
jgi:uncharacterized protein (DUF1800 family)